MEHGSSIDGFILIGGASRRMGHDKFNLKLGDASFWERIANSLSPLVRNITLVDSINSTKQLPVTTIRDSFQGLGALGGLHAALAACRREWAFVIACDMPLVSSGFLLYLAEQRFGFEAVAPLESDSTPQPLCALYRVAPCLAVCERLISTREYRPRALLGEVKTRWVTMDELSEVRGFSEALSNINTPNDLFCAEQLLKG